MKIGIIGAMELETELLKAMMADKKQTTVAGLEFCSGVIKGCDVVVVTCGIGKTNAALCTQILISTYDVTHVVNTGVSGAILSTLEVGDIVVSTDCMHHDFDCTGFGYEHGIIPRMPHSVFKADEQLMTLAYEAGLKTADSFKVYKGRIVSGDQFVSSMARKTFIEETFSAYTTEMEGASIAHTCDLNSVPFVIIRSMSDKADGSAHVNFDAFAQEAAKNSVKIVLTMLEQLVG